MKIVISSLTYPLLNGVTISINLSVNELKKNGVESIIISPDYEIGRFRLEHCPVNSSILAKNITALVGKKERIFGSGSYDQIKEIVEKFNPDIFWLHTLSWPANVFEKYMLKNAKIKVLTYHTMVEEYGRIYGAKLGAAVMRKRSKMVCEEMDLIITPSQTTKEKLKEYGVTKPIDVVPTGIEITENQFKKEEILKRFNIHPENKILLHVGRISKEKNLKDLLQLMVDLKKKNYQAVLLFVGPGDIDKTKKSAEKMGVGDKVIFSGPLLKEEAHRMYGACDAFVFSSQTETQGLVIGEAMAAKTLVVALRSPIQEEVYPEGTAIVVYDKSKFSSQLVEILENDKKRNEIIKKAKDFVSTNFSKELMIERQIKIFEKLLKK